MGKLEKYIIFCIINEGVFYNKDVCIFWVYINFLLKEIFYFNEWFEIFWKVWLFFFDVGWFFLKVVIVDYDIEG